MNKIFVCLLAFLISSLISLIAAPVTEKNVVLAVNGWLNLDASPLGSPLDREVVDVNRYVDDNKETLFFVASLESGGYVITSADDMINPIIAFSESGSFDTSASSPLWALLNQDMQGRNTFVKKVAAKAAAPRVLSMADQAALESIHKTQLDWEKLISTAEDNGGVATLGIDSGSISDLCVAPLVQSQWGQMGAYGLNLYNYYSPNNYPDGCVATALAQLMRYHEYPVSSIGVHEYNITVDSMPQVASTRGGDGVGGAYSWDLMPLRPGPDITLEERQMIGSLCYDAGVSVEMSYEADGSGTDTLLTADALKDLFGYSNAVKQYGNPYWGGIWRDDFLDSINPNLDASLPVLLGIVSFTAGGHAIVCDGYGYNLDNMYHHLNMGWDGFDDLWYALPNVDTTSYDFTILYKVVYNVFKSGTGEILSGRVLDPFGLPIVGVTVSTPGFSDVTDENGIYAFVGIPAGYYEVETVKAGFENGSSFHTVGTSVDEGACGNVWGADFTLIAGGNPRALLHVNVVGAEEVHENSFDRYWCTAQYSDGSTDIVNLTAIWEENSDSASITGDGVLTATDVNSDQIVTISALYTDGGVTETGTLDVNLKNVLAGSLYSGGSGFESDPYHIDKKADLLYLAEHSCDYDKHFVMTDDIDLSGEYFSAALIAPDLIAATESFEGIPFSGTFDGDGYIIDQLDVLAEDHEGWIGLFGNLSGEVYDLGLEGVSVVGEMKTGALCGLLSGSVERCYAMGVVSGSDYIGGLCGYNDAGTFLNCYAQVEIEFGVSFVGGFCGYSDGGLIDHCYSTGRVYSLGWDIGGFCGLRYEGRTTVTDCFWDYESCGLDQAESDGGIGKTTAEMQTQPTFENWDFAALWQMEGYPALQIFDGTLETITIIGPSEVDEMTVTNYICEASFRNGVVITFTNQVVWSEDSPFAEIDKNGILSVFDVPTNLSVTITAVCTNKGNVASATHIVKVKDYPTLISLEVYGPESVFERKSAEFYCVASYSDGVISNVTEHATWVEDNDYTTIDSAGILISTFIETDQSVIVSAAYTFGEKFSTTMNVTADIVIINLLPGSQYSGGFGMEEDPFIIADKEDFLNFASNTNHYDRHFIQAGNIGLADEMFDQAVVAPDTSSEIGFQGVSFSGVFDGNGYVIDGLVIDGRFGYGYLGLFGHVTGGLSKLGLKNVNISGLGSNGSLLGGICGYLGEGIIENSFATGSINAYFGAAGVGGLCGKINGGVVRNCFAGVNVKGYLSVGGFCGYLDAGELSNSYSYGSVTGLTEINIGGFSGSVRGGAFIGCFWDTQTSGCLSSAGGTGLVTAQMQMEQTFTNSGWDFVDIWHMYAYPALICFESSVIGGTYEDWLLNNADIPIGQRAHDDTPADDGIPNLLKYACGLTAMELCNTADLMAIADESGAVFSILYYKSKSANDVTLDPIWAETLAGPWSAVGLTIELVGEDAERELRKASIPLGDSGFIRLRATAD